MSATIVTQLETIRRELRNTRRTAHVESCRRNARAFGRALRQIDALERAEDSLGDVCECGRPSCRGQYKPDGSHELAF